MATSRLLPGSHNTVLTENEIDLGYLYSTYRCGFRISVGVNWGAQVWELAAQSMATRCWDSKQHQELWVPPPHCLPSSSPALWCSSCMESINYPPCINGSQEMPCRRMHCAHCSSAEEEEHRAAPHGTEQPAPVYPIPWTAAPVGVWSTGRWAAEHSGLPLLLGTAFPAPAQKWRW